MVGVVMVIGIQAEVVIAGKHENIEHREQADKNTEKVCHYKIYIYSP